MGHASSRSHFSLSGAIRECLCRLTHLVLVAAMLSRPPNPSQSCLMNYKPALVRGIQQLQKAARPSTIIPLGAKTVSSLTQTMEWAHDGLERSVFEAKHFSKDMVMAACRGQEFTLTSSFSGIACFDLAGMFCERAVNDFLIKHCGCRSSPACNPHTEMFSVRPLAAIEKSKKCRSELLAAPYMLDACIFYDMFDLLTPEARKRVEPRGKDS